MAEFYENMEDFSMNRVEQYIINIQEGTCPSCGKRNTKLHLYMLNYALFETNKAIPICGCHKCIMQILEISNNTTDSIKDKEIEILKLKLELSNLKLKYK
jgi:C4-type Zn-finger protein